MIRRGVRSLFRLAIRSRERLEEELDEEIAAHLAMRIEQLVRRGMSPDVARAEARRRFGLDHDARRALVCAARERESTMHVREWWDDLRHDLAFAARTMAKSPGFTLAVVLTLALGIGASSAMFTVVNAVLLRPIGFAELERLAILTELRPNGEPNRSVSSANFHDWREQSRTFGALAAWTSRERILTGDGEPEELSVHLTTGNFFDVLGARPILGRGLTERDEAEENVAVLSHRFWQRRFGGEPGIVGRTITLADQPIEVVGVMPPALPSIHEKPELWMPLQTDPEW